MTAPFRKVYDETSAVSIIEAAEKHLILKLQKQSAVGQGLLSFGIFHTSSSATVPKEEDAPKITKKWE